MKKTPIFLSASVPDEPTFCENFDPMAIREAILALVAVTVRERDLVFGGHPAISPLVEHAARSLNAIRNVHIFQSRFFENVIPEVAKEFPNLHWTKRLVDRETSLEEMRQEMIPGRGFGAAVYVGGMQGIFDEHRIFSKEYPGKPEIFVATTGGATAKLLSDLRSEISEEIFHEFSHQRRYRAFFRKHLPD